MKRITLDVQPEPANPRAQFTQRAIFAMIGVTNLVQALMKDNDFRYVNLIVGLGTVLFAIFYRRFNRPKVFTFDDDGIEGPLGARNPVKMKWNDIARIEGSVFRLTVLSKSGDRSDINLGNITYDQHKQIKPLILELAQSHGVEVRTTGRTVGLRQRGMNDGL